MLKQFKGKAFTAIIVAVLIGGIFAIFFGIYESDNQGDPIVQVKLPKNLPPEAIAGRELFEKNCSTCHGKNAGGSSNGPPLVHGIYKPNHHSDESFYGAAKNGVRGHHWPFGNMPPVADVTQMDVKQIISYVRTLQRENGIF